MPLTPEEQRVVKEWVVEQLHDDAFYEGLYPELTQLQSCRVFKASSEIQICMLDGRCQTFKITVQET